MLTESGAPVRTVSENFRSPTGQKVKPNMADMEALSYVGFSPPVQFLLYA